MDVLWVVAPCSLVDVYRRFRGARRLHRQGDEAASTYDMSVIFYQTTGAITQKTAIFILIARRTEISQDWKKCTLWITLKFRRRSLDDNTGDDVNRSSKALCP
jgi:hypothetical protein